MTNTPSTRPRPDPFSTAGKPLTTSFSAGANVLALARMLGHKDASGTLRVYSDLFDTDLDALADVMDRAYAGKCGQNAATASGSR